LPAFFGDKNGFQLGHRKGRRKDARARKTVEQEGEGVALDGEIKGDLVLNLRQRQKSSFFLFMTPPFPKEILDEIRRAGEILSATLRVLRDSLQSGISGLELEEIAQEEIRGAGGVPAFQNYQPEYAPSPFPFALCFCPENAVVHAFPSSRRLKEGELVTLDLGVRVGKGIADAAFSAGIGEISPERKNLIAATEEALAKAKSIARAGISNREIGREIHAVFKKRGVAPTWELCGHGCGVAVHRPPIIWNFENRRAEKEILREGDVVCLEPIATTGSGKICFAADGWGCLAKESRALASQSEAMVLIKADGCEVLAELETV
jgi:methionyl aminopeptidase